LDEKQSILRVSKDHYGTAYQDHYLDIYKIYLASADKISDRRQSANSFFLSVNTALVGLIGYLQSDSTKTTLSPVFYLLISLSGVLICYAWYRLVKSYRQLNSGKFKVIHEIEKNLPLSPYDAEWEMLGRGKDSEKYLPFTHVEAFVPQVFGGLHLFLFLQGCVLVLYP
jgi:uncharacterized membrane protein YuzA (DUF378 family)